MAHSYIATSTSVYIINSFFVLFALHNALVTFENTISLFNSRKTNDERKRDGWKTTSSFLKLRRTAWRILFTTHTLSITFLHPSAPATLEDRDNDKQRRPKHRRLIPFLNNYGSGLRGHNLIFEDRGRTMQQESLYRAITRLNSRGRIAARAPVLLLIYFRVHTQ